MESDELLVASDIVSPIHSSIPVFRDLTQGEGRGSLKTAHRLKLGLGLSAQNLVNPRSRGRIAGQQVKGPNVRPDIADARLAVMLDEIPLHAGARRRDELLDQDGRYAGRNRTPKPPDDRVPVDLLSALRKRGEKDLPADIVRHLAHKRQRALADPGADDSNQAAERGFSRQFGWQTPTGNGLRDRSLS